MPIVRVRLRERAESYEIRIGAGLLKDLGEIARRSLTPDTRRVAVISNRKVFSLYGDRVMRSLRAAGFAASHWLMGDGERYKSFRTLERALKFLSETKLERTDAVVALGGGVVGDLAGFAASVYMRGIAYLQAPTTLLAQIDSSVGGKTAVNTEMGKNLIGAFHHPRAVVIDTQTLSTLPRRELTAGLCECIKQGAVGGRRLFDLTHGFMLDEREAQRDDGRLAELIAAQCSFKAEIVSKDELESVSRTDSRSRRVLNFGHTVGHALEQVTRYQRFKHGEAVGWGMLAACELGKRLGISDVSDLESIRAAIQLAGRLPRANDLPPSEILGTLARDKKSVGGHIKWILLERIGRARLVDGREIAPATLRASIRAALQTTT
ncbi:MAG: 3-dehydroquinate synthase [Acidobacteria bacterium]|nr:3-dehydroquinate synthase [Acidobacteriota bacterium]